MSIKKIIFPIILCIFSTSIWALPPADEPLPYPGFIGVGASLSPVKGDPAYFLNFTASNRIGSMGFVGMDYSAQLDSRTYEDRGEKFSLNHSTFGAHFSFTLIEKQNWGLSLPLYCQLGILTSIFSTSEEGEGVDYFFAPAAGLDFYYRLTANFAMAINGGWLQALGVEDNGLADGDFSRPYVALQVRWTP